MKNVLLYILILLYCELMLYSFFTLEYYSRYSEAQEVGQFFTFLILFILIIIIYYQSEQERLSKFKSKDTSQKINPILNESSDEERDSYEKKLSELRSKIKRELMEEERYNSTNERFPHVTTSKKIELLK